MRPSLNVTLSTRLAMTPSLLQKIELLHLNQLELSGLMTEELVKNPLLEEVASDGGDAEPEREPAAEAEKPEAGETNSDDMELEAFLDESYEAPFRNREFEANDDRPTFETFLAAPSNLFDYLSWQLQLSDCTPQLREIVEFLIGNLSEDGYLRVTEEETAAALGTTEEEFKAALDLLQSLDPVGVGARSLPECLSLQLRAEGLAGSLADELVLNHLHALEKRKYKELAKLLHVELADIGEALKAIEKLSPNPGQRFNSREPAYVRPDVYIEKTDDGYRIQLNDDGLPKLRVNRSFRRQILKGEESKETKSYVRERFRAAMELLRSIDQRQQTIARVCRAIVQRQQEFLEHGRLYLKPMLIKDIAGELGVHPSTISRVVANKWAHTPQGVIELRSFFTVGVEGKDGENVSSAHVKEKIRKIIEMEDSKRPLSDQRISKMLSQQGIQITRRTVAKYRDQMNLPGSRERKESVLQ